MQKVLNLFDFSQKVNYKTEILAGLTVAMTMIPESLSFAILAGFPPLVGLYGAFIMGLITAIFGGRPGLISGGAGATEYARRNPRQHRRLLGARHPAHARRTL